MENYDCMVKGTGGIVYAYNDHVVISRKSATGFITQGIRGDKTIYYSDVKSIEYKKPTFLANGYIQFITTTELAKNQSVGLLGTHKEAMKDPNAVILRAIKKQTVSDAENLHDYVMEQWERTKQNKGLDSSKSESTPTDDIPAQLTEYKKLLDQGILTRDEFEAKKKQILGI